MKKIISILILNSFVLSFFSFNFNSNLVKAQVVTSSDCVSLNYNLKYGSRDYNTNGEVSKLQNFLHSEGFLQSYPTGYFGNMTKNAVANYQAYKGLYISGNVLSLTRNAIYNDTCNVNPTTIPNQTSIQSYYCSINGLTYYSLSSYNSSCINYSPVVTYYCSINSQTYYSQTDYNNNCFNNQNTFCPTSGDFYDSQYKNCSCSSNLNKILTSGTVSPNYWTYRCVATTNVCPIGINFYEYNYSGCACPSGYTKTDTGLVGGPAQYYCKNN